MQTKLEFELNSWIKITRTNKIQSWKIKYRFMTREKGMQQDVIAQSKISIKYILKIHRCIPKRVETYIE